MAWFEGIRSKRSSFEVLIVIISVAETATCVIATGRGLLERRSLTIQISADTIYCVPSTRITIITGLKFPKVRVNPSPAISFIRLTITWPLILEYSTADNISRP
jgi:hypothetical protein